MNTLASGTKIIYAREDSGGSIQNDNETVLVAPNKPLTVGTDVTAGLAARLVEDKVCTVYSLPPVEAQEVAAKPEEKTEDKPEEDKPEEDKPEEAKPEEAKAEEQSGLVLG